MRLVLMGTSAFAVPVLTSLIDSKHELAAVVTQPDRPAGRHQRLQPSPVKVLAQQHELCVLQPERASSGEFVAQLNALAPEIICVVAYGQILRKRVLDLPPHGCLNVHPSLLPRYRGPAPIQRAIINGEASTGVTIMLLDEGQDTGDIILQREMVIPPEATSISLAETLADLSGPLLLEAIDLATDGPPPHTPQDHTQASHAPKLSKEEAVIDWHQPAERIHNQIRGMLPWPGSLTYLPDGTPLKLISSTTGDFPGQTSVPGTICVTNQRELWVQTALAGLQLHTVQPANKQPMPASDFINGYHLASGDMIGIHPEVENSG